MDRITAIGDLGSTPRYSSFGSLRLAEFRQIGTWYAALNAENLGNSPMETRKIFKQVSAPFFSEPSRWDLARRWLRRSIQDGNLLWQ